MNTFFTPGADVNMGSGGPEKAGQTALYRATCLGVPRNDDPILRALIDRGADRSTAAVPRDLEAF